VLNQVYPANLELDDKEYDLNGTDNALTILQKQDGLVHCQSDRAELDRYWTAFQEN
jgi:hypothetical protein